MTYYEDHSRWEDAKNGEPIASKLYGAGAERKLYALETAVEMAKAA